jgi:hypothetical protein
MNKHPDRWVIVKLTTPQETIYKILGSWYGGYAGSDSWQISSGIVSIVENEQDYEIHNLSGSVYVCPKHAYGMSGYTFLVYSGWEKENSDELSITTVKETEIPGIQDALKVH